MGRFPILWNNQTSPKMKTRGDMLEPLNTLLWLHGFGFTMDFCWTRKYFAQVTISVLLLLLFDGSLLLSVYQRFLRDINDIHRRLIVITIIRILECLLRVAIHLKRKDINQVVKRMSKMCFFITAEECKKIKRALVFILITNDICTICFSFLYLTSKDLTRVFVIFDDYYYLGFIPPPYSTFAFNAGVICCQWSSMVFVIPTYFCCFCYVLTKALQEFRKKVVKEGKGNVDFFQLGSRKLTDLVCCVNQVLHTILVLTYAILLSRLFYNSYLIAFKEQPKTVYRSCAVVLHFTRLLLMCAFASSVTKAASELKDVLYDLPVDESERWKNLQFIIKMKDTFVGFKLLDSLVIDRNLVLSAVGMLLTYGIMVATFNINSTE